MKIAMLETHLRHLLRASRMNPGSFLRPEIFPKATNARRNASRRIFGLGTSGRPYRRHHWPEFRYHLTRRSYHTAYMRMWRKKNRQNVRLFKGSYFDAVSSYNLLTDSLHKTIMVNTPSNIPNGKCRQLIPATTIENVRFFRSRKNNADIKFKVPQTNRNTAPIT
jgi:hypothetical protein